MPSGPGGALPALRRAARRAAEATAARVTGRAPRRILDFARIATVCFAVGLPAGPAWARFERSSVTPRAAATGRAYASAADDASSIFVNPAGLVSVAGPVLYGDYAEPRGTAGGRETRGIAAADARYVQCALAWYRRDAGEVVDDLFVAGFARTLLTGSQGSYVAVGASAVLGRAGVPPGGAGGGERTAAGADAGIVVRPLPVISFAWAAQNVFEADLPADDGEGPWGRTSRWGLSYFWEDALVLSFESARSRGGTTRHYGVLARTALPIEIMFGLSGGEMTGGARCSLPRATLVVAFESEGARGATWSVALQGSFGSAGEGDGR